MKYIYALKIQIQKFQLLINKRKNLGSKHCNDPKSFIECTNYMNIIYQNIDAYNPNKKGKILIAFDNMIADILSNKNLNVIVTEQLN